MAVCQEDFEIKPNRVIDLDFVTMLKGKKIKNKIMLVVNMHSCKASIVDQLICIHTSSTVYWILGHWVDDNNIIIGIVYIVVWSRL